MSAPDYAVPSSPCWFCGKVSFAALGIAVSSEVTQPQAPRPGDVTLCTHCAEWNIFDDELAMRRPTLAERRRILASWKMRKAQEVALVAILRHRLRGG